MGIEEDVAHVVQACDVLIVGTGFCICGAKGHPLAAREPTIEEWSRIQQHIKGIPWSETEPLMVIEERQPWNTSSGGC